MPERSEDQTESQGADRTEERAEEEGDLPRAVVDDAERLTRLARQAVDDAERAAYLEERDSMLDEHDFEARVRDDEDAGETLVCHPTEWTEDGVIRPERVDDVDRGVERSLSGTERPDEWGAVAAHNDDLVDAVADEDGEVHAANARALADFASNHYAKEIESLAESELEEFLSEYFTRNAWPSERQRSLVEESVRRVFEKTSVRCPLGE